MREVYQNEEDANVVDDTLEAMVREGARRMLAAALEEEVSGFLGRDRYERGEEFCGYRNGYHRSRELTVGVSAVEVKAPRVSDVPAEVAGGGFESKIVRRYERTSRQTQDLFRKLYLEGLSTGDFEPVFRELVGETAALSPNAIVRLKSKWESEYRAWGRRRLDEHRYAYIWADGVYLRAGVDREKTALLCVVGAREDGVKELLGMELGYRESTESWSGVLRELEGSGSDVAAAIGGWETVLLGSVGCARCGVSDDRSSEVLEPPCAEYAVPAAEGAACGGKTPLETDVCCAHARGVREATGRVCV